MRHFLRCRTFLHIFNEQCNLDLHPPDKTLSPSHCPFINIGPLDWPFFNWDQWCLSTVVLVFENVVFYFLAMLLCIGRMTFFFVDNCYCIFLHTNNGSQPVSCWRPDPRAQCVTRLWSDSPVRPAAAPSSAGGGGVGGATCSTRCPHPLRWRPCVQFFIESFQCCLDCCL